MEELTVHKSKLYIIGNGFDLHHSLPTKYEHFHCFLEQNYPDLLKFIDFYFEMGDAENKYLWKDFENDLSTFNHKIFFEDYDHADISHEKFKTSDYFGAEDELNEISENFIENLQTAFREWLNEIEYVCHIKYDLDTTSKFLSFNYTNLLQDHYLIPSELILHIHGDLKSDTELLFGHGGNLEQEPDFDEYGEPTRTFITDSINASKQIFSAFKKPVLEIMNDNNDYFKSLANLGEIIILGHSLNVVDIPYFKEIQANARNANWKVSFYERDQQEVFSKILKEIGIDESRLEFFKM